MAHPGLAHTSLPKNTSTTSPGSFLDNKIGVRLIKNFAQGEGDGCLPMLAAAVAPEAASGDFYIPGHIGMLGRVRPSSCCLVQPCAPLPAACDAFWSPYRSTKRLSEGTQTARLCTAGSSIQNISTGPEMLLRSSFPELLVLIGLH